MVVDWVEGKKGGVGQHNSPLNREMAESSSESIDRLLQPFLLLPFRCIRKQR